MVAHAETEIVTGEANTGMDAVHVIALFVTGRQGCETPPSNMEQPAVPAVSLVAPPEA
jgi:hypothetical protein